MEQIQTDVSQNKANGFVLGGAAILAVLTASCCILPLGLTIIGLGGSWLTFLGPFVAYRSYILVAVGLIVLWSWISLWRSPCGLFGNRNALLIRIALTGIFLAALTAPYWENGIARSMWEYLRDNQ